MNLSVVKFYRFYLLSFFLFMGTACVTAPVINPNATTFDAEAALEGTSSSPEQCASGVNAVWAEYEGKGECIRYFPGGPLASSKTAIIYFTGDLGLWDAWTVYIRQTPESVQKQSELWARRLGIPYVLVSRPGTFGSSGNHYKDRRAGNNGHILNAAIDALKTKYGTEKFIFVGQSGGGYVAARILTLRRDISCAIFASTPLSYKDIYEPGDTVSYKTRLQMKRSWDPIEHIADIPASSHRRIFILADPKDKIIGFSSQKKYYEKVREQGLNAAFIETHGFGREHHGLGGPARYLASMCAKDKSTEEMVRFIKRRSDDVAKSLNENRGKDIVRGKDQARIQANKTMSPYCKAKFETYISQFWHSETGVFAYSKGQGTAEACGSSLRLDRRDAIESALHICEYLRDQDIKFIPEKCYVFAIKDSVYGRE